MKDLVIIFEFINIYINIYINIINYANKKNF